VTTSAPALLAATAPPTPGTTSTSTPRTTGPVPDLVTPGVAGFLVVFLLALATIVLLRSMTKHLRKVRYSPDPAAEPPGDDRAPGPARNGAPPA
jgi:hypothetical protein